ncbi:MAG: DNA polymerase III subunit beta [Parcubacteria group bacterium]|nr:DNA polymerase III subunit beta [Parcubacteria group bacterium]
MKCILLRDHLNNALSIVEKSLGTNEIMPILKNILIKAQSGKIQLIATNLETALIATIPGKIEEEGEVAVSGSLLFQVINNIKDEKIECSTKDNQLQIHTDMFQGELVTVSISDFPLIPKIQETTYVEVEAKQFKKGIDTVFLAISFNTIRPELNGMYVSMHESKKKLILAGSDGFRLAEKQIDILKSEVEAISCIIPTKTLQLLGRMLDTSPTGVLKIIIEAHQSVFILDGFVLISNLVDGTYPSYEHFVPKEFETELLVSKSGLTDAVRLSSVFSSKLNDITMHIAPDEGVVKIKSSNTVFGAGEINVPGQVKGIEQFLRMNARYIQDGAKAIDDANLKISIVNGEKPIKIESLIDKSAYYIVMPIKI